MPPCGVKHTQNGPENTKVLEKPPFITVCNLSDETVLFVCLSVSRISEKIDRF